MRSLVFSFLLANACTYQDSLSRACPLECYTGPERMKGVGECRAGKPVCDEEMNVISCDGEVLPSQEICDGLDNNCDGLADDLIYPVHYYDFYPGRYGLETFPCLFRGACARGNLGCIDGAWECSYYDTGAETLPDHSVVEEETLCDGIDNDCDGLVDEDLFRGQYCYEGPIGSEVHAPCHPGALKCHDGEAVCVNQGTPSLEVCDGIDNDCNGIADDSSGFLERKYDIVFSIDTSQSMCDKINAVYAATDLYAESWSGNDNFKFALVIMTAHGSSLVHLSQNFTDIETFRDSLSYLNCNGTYEEASYDAIYDVCDASNNLGLAWQPGALRLYFGFTDEAAQSYSNPVATEWSIVDACLETGVRVYQWAYDEEDFLYITQETQGRYFDLPRTYQDILDDLNSIIFTLCE